MALLNLLGLRLTVWGFRDQFGDLRMAVWGFGPWVWVEGLGI